MQGTTVQTPLSRLVDDYLSSCQARGLSLKTTSHYASVLRTVLLPFCAAAGIERPDQLTQRDLDRLNAQLLNQGGPRGQLSRHSVKSYVSTINFFLAWARKEGELTTEVKAQIPRLPRRRIEVLDRNEIKALEDAAPTERDKLIIRLLADTGLRASELLDLRTGDLVEQGRDRYLRVIGKGDKERLVPIPGLYPRLRRYVERGRPKDAISDRVFLTLRRRPDADYEPFKITGLEQSLRFLGKQVLGKRVYPHLFRYSYVTWALSRNMNPLQLREIVGHESLDMINRIYAQLTASDAHAAMVRLLREDD